MVQDTPHNKRVTMRNITIQETTECKKKKVTRKQREMGDDIQTNHDISKTEKSKNTNDAPSVIVEKEVEKEEINHDISETEKSKHKLCLKCNS